MPTGSSRIPQNSGGRGLDAALRNAPNSGEFGYAQLPRLRSLKLRMPTGSSRIPQNSGGRGLDAAFCNAPNSGEFGYAQLPRLRSLKLRMPTGSSRIPQNSGGRGLDAAFRNAPNSGEFGYAQLPRLRSLKFACQPEVAEFSRIRAAGVGRRLPQRPEFWRIRLRATSSLTLFEVAHADRK